jgi:hypothetical protein
MLPHSGEIYCLYPNSNIAFHLNVVDVFPVIFESVM